MPVNKCQHAAHTTNQVISPSCYTGAIQKSLPLNERETFNKRYTAEMFNKAEIRPEEQNEQAESCREDLWNKIQLKGPSRQK